MKRFSLFALVILSGWLVNTDAYTTKISSSKSMCNMFAEKNKLYLEDPYYAALSNMTEERFNEIIDSVVTYYTPIAEAHDAQLYVERNWDDPEVNAYASRPQPGVWQVAMFGGLARRPEVTEDGFALVVCHELGHQFGGYPFARMDWAANEGQSDYFATQACARNIWKKEIEANAAAAELVTPEIRSYCDVAWQETNDRNLCYRIGGGSQSLAHLLAKLRGVEGIPSPDSPDQSQVSQTATVHPEPQCRLDTYMSGAICKKNFNDQVIPGLVNGNGQSTSTSETEASLYSCMRSDGSSAGTRPLCWFAPLMQLKLLASDARIVEVDGNHDDVVDPGETYALHVPAKNTFLFNIPSAKGTLMSSQAAVLENTAIYQNLLSDASVLPDEPVTFKIHDSMTCGESFDLDYTVSTRNLSHAIRLDYRTGAPDIASEVLSSFTDPITIPDKDDAGIDSVLMQTSDEAIAEIEVHVQIDHSYIGDLQIELKEPNGHVHMLKRKYDGHGRDLDKSYKIVPNSADVSGDWTLNVSDRAVNDIGTLKGWDLKFFKIKCNPFR